MLSGGWEADRTIKCHLSVIKLISRTQYFIIKTQSEARLDYKVLLVRVTAEVMSLEMRFETRGPIFEKS